MNIQRPLLDDKMKLINDILWSDPNLEMLGFNESLRGAGCTFGGDVLAEFLDKNNLTCLIRGHQCVENGYDVCFNQRLITVFSASNYCGYQGNSGAVMVIDPNDQIANYFNNDEEGYDLISIKYTSKVNGEMCEQFYQFVKYSVEQDILNKIAVLPKIQGLGKKFFIKSPRPLHPRAIFPSPVRRRHCFSDNITHEIQISKNNSDIHTFSDRKIKSFNSFQIGYGNRKVMGGRNSDKFIKVSLSDNIGKLEPSIISIVNK